MVALEMGGFSNKTTKMSFFKASQETKELRVISSLQMLFLYNNQQLSNSHMDGCDQKVGVKLQIHQNRFPQCPALTQSPSPLQSQASRSNL